MPVGVIDVWSSVQAMGSSRKEFGPEVIGVDWMVENNQWQGECHHVLNRIRSKFQARLDVWLW
jgi:hypothetical protein